MATLLQGNGRIVPALKGRFWPRYAYTIYDMPYTIFDMRYTDIRYAIYDIRYAIYDIRYAIYDIRYAIYDIRYTIYDIRYTYTIYDIRYTIFQVVHIIRSLRSIVAQIIESTTSARMAMRGLIRSRFERYVFARFRWYRNFFSQRSSMSRLGSPYSHV